MPRHARLNAAGVLHHVIVLALFGHSEEEALHVNLGTGKRFTGRKVPLS